VGIIYGTSQTLKYTRSSTPSTQTPGSRICCGAQRIEELDLSQTPLPTRLGKVPTLGAREAVQAGAASLLFWIWRNRASAF
jgi:hypothetical protein